MKILFFIESLEAGGKERRLVELLKVLSCNKKFTIELVLTRTGIAYQEIKDLDIKIHFIERTFFKKDPLLFYKFYKIAKEFKPDLIHVWGNMVAIYAIPAKVFLKIPMINSQITDAPEKIYSGILGHKLPFFFSDLIIANSNAGLLAYNAPQNKSSVIYNGFNFNRLRQLKAKAEIREQFSINTKYIIGMVATFSKAKDYKTYIKAANKVLNKNANVTFLCVGAGDDSQIRAMVEDLI